MKCRILIIILAVMNLLPLAAEEINVKELVAVFPLKAEGISAVEASVFTNHITAQIHESGKFRVIDHSEQEKLLNELKFSLSGCVDEGCQLEAGKMLSANKIITGSIGVFGENFLVSLKFIDVETGETINAVSEYYSDMDDILDESGDLVESLIEGTTLTNTHEKPKSGYIKPKIGYFSISSGYGEIYRQAGEGPVVAGISDIDGFDHYASATSESGPFSAPFSGFRVTQYMVGIPVVLGYEYPVMPELSAGIWGSYLISDYYPERFEDNGDPISEDENIYALNAASEVIGTEDIPDLNRWAAGISATFRISGDTIGIKLDVGYNFSEIIIIKAGVSYWGIFVKGVIGVPIDGVWTSSYEDGGIWGIQVGYDMKI